MNNTNRVLNRTLTVLIGLLALLVGAALVAIAVVPGIRENYRSTAPGVRDDITGWLKSTPLGSTGTSWGWILVLAALALIVVLLLVFIFRQGHGHHSIIYREQTSVAGTTVIDANVAEQLIQHDLDNHSEFVASRVSTYQVKRDPVLKISVTCRRGVSPRDVVTIVESSLGALDEVLGSQIPALIQISGGFRARVASSTRT